MEIEVVFNKDCIILEGESGWAKDMVLNLANYLVLKSGISYKVIRMTESSAHHIPFRYLEIPKSDVKKLLEIVDKLKLNDYLDTFKIFLWNQQ